MTEDDENEVLKPPQAPKALQKGGRALWRAMWSVFDFREEPHLLAILEQACRTRDEIDRLELEMAGEPYIVQGSASQVQVHPLVSEARFQRKTLAELLGRLSVPDNSDPADPRARRREAGRAWRSRSMEEQRLLVPKRWNTKSVSRSPEALAARPNVLRSFDAWHYPDGLRDDYKALADSVPDHLTTPVMNAAGLSAADWFRHMFSHPTKD
jgi:hypothetical protein